MAKFISTFRNLLCCYKMGRLSALLITCITTPAVIIFPALANAAQPEPWGIGLQPSASPSMEAIAGFNNAILLPIAIGISCFVLALLVFVIIRFRAKANPNPSKTAHNTLLEIIWTAVPVIILLIIVIPSMRVLYFTDRTAEPEMTLMVVGYQWYWGYSYPDQQIPEFASYMIPDDQLQEGQPRLLATDRPVILPVDTNIQLLITAGDVLHSWAMPAGGVKIDAVPGRTNEGWIRFEEEGTFYGQCSELCGRDHAFMPIEIEVVSRAEFNEWARSQTDASDPQNPPVFLSEGSAAEHRADPENPLASGPVSRVEIVSQESGFIDIDNNE